MSDPNGPLKAVWLMNLSTLWILKDKGIVTDAEIQERLRQTKQMFEERYGEGAGTAIIEATMLFVAKRTGVLDAEIVPFPGQSDPNQKS